MIEHASCVNQSDISDTNQVVKCRNLYGGMEYSIYSTRLGPTYQSHHLTIPWWLPFSKDMLFQLVCSQYISCLVAMFVTLAFLLENMRQVLNWKWWCVILVVTLVRILRKQPTLTLPYLLKDMTWLVILPPCHLDDWWLVGYERVVDHWRGLCHGPWRIPDGYQGGYYRAG